MSCYYDLAYQDVSWERGNLEFQEIPAISKNKNDVRNKGWIHFDSDNHKNYPYELAGLIYLTPDIDPDSGTSLFTLKQQNNKEYKIFQKQFAKNLLYKNTNILDNNEEFDEAFFIKEYKEHEEFFIEKTRFANIYNRMITYDTNEFHRANNYYNDDEKDNRLTLVFFIGGINAGSFPLEKIKDEELDEFIEYQSDPIKAFSQI